MVNRKTVLYTTAIILVGGLAAQAQYLMYNQYKLQKDFTKVIEEQKLQKMQPAAGEVEKVEETPVQIEEPITLDKPKAEEIAKVYTVTRPKADEKQSKEYAMRPAAPFTETDVSKVRQSDIRKTIKRAEIIKKEKPAEVPSYKPESQQTQPILSGRVPDPSYKLQPWQEQRLREMGVQRPTEPTPAPAPQVAAEEPAKDLVLGGEITGSLGATSNYSFRGVNQSKGKPAIQGGIEYAHLKGVYLGAWGSNVDFNDGDEAQTEFDFYGGYRTAITDELSADAGVIYYSYPGSSRKLSYDFAEVYVSAEYAVPVKADLGHGFALDKATIGASFNYSPNYFADSGSAFYPKLSASLPLGNGFTLDGHVGKQWIRKNSAFALPDYIDWSVGLAYALPHDFEVKLQYIDTNISKKECADGCDARGILSLSKNF